ncbi:MAG: hypothetical protein APF84_14455 [Gracilibacter sp. BRH_c7a]|nr:MAG: hypothetical protein APF84_14455 [Gracilibacter sp. BRH_c7a]
MKEQMLTVVESRRSVYNLLAELFLNPIPTPGSEYAQKFSEALGDLARLPDQGDYGEGLRLLNNFKTVANCGDLENIQKNLAVDRTKLCRGTAKKDAVIPPYEALYLSPEKEVDQLLAIVQFYQKAGLKVSAGHFERMDYIGIEFAFMAELCTKERLALDSEQKEKFESVLALEKEFLNQHLLKWALDYCGQVIVHAETEFFRGFGYLIRAFLYEEKEFCEQ